MGMLSLNTENQTTVITDVHILFISMAKDEQDGSLKGVSVVEKKQKCRNVWKKRAQGYEPAHGSN